MVLNSKSNHPQRARPKCTVYLQSYFRNNMALLLPYSTGQVSHKDLPRVKGKGQKPSPAPQWEESQGDIRRAGRMGDAVVAIPAKQNLSHV